MPSIMGDLETLGQSAGCVILSIGAVVFDWRTDTLGKEFYVVVNKQSCEDVGLFTDPSTVAWWEKQSPEARKVLDDAVGPHSVPLSQALMQFNEFISSVCEPKAMKVWGNGSDFDNAILASCYRATGVKQGWDFWNNRCYRTLKGFKPGLKAQRAGTYHNALDDAKTQAAHALELIKVLGL